MNKPNPRPADAGAHTGASKAHSGTGTTPQGRVESPLDGRCVFQPQDLFVSTAGDDNWSGKLPEPNANGTDGPLATPAGARNTLRERKGLGTTTFNGDIIRTEPVGPTNIWLRAGRYRLEDPLSFDHRDSAPTAYRAFPGETPILDGGRLVAGWQSTEVNGVAAWVADLPEVARDEWSFRRLYVNGVNCPRTTPNGKLQIGDLYYPEDVPGICRDVLTASNSVFTCRPGDIRAWRNLEDVELVFIHYWIEERTPIRSFDPQTRRVEMARKSKFVLMDSYRGETRRFAPYYVENVFEALTEPGQWYLDRPAGKLYYVPREGQTPENTTITAPVARQLLTVGGNPMENRFVEHLSFEGLVFEHTDAPYPGEGGAPITPSTVNGIATQRHRDRGTEYASAAQAACDVPGTVVFSAARHCAVRNCTVRNTGWYGIELGDGCTGIQLVGNTLHELGAGGIKVGGAEAGEDRRLQTGRNRITDNHVHAAGQVFHSAVGILLMHSHTNIVSHNLVHDLPYSGISCGWNWTLAETVSRNNLIEKNHIHHIGNGWLDDVGGVYVLGVQAGTVVRGNLIHDVRHRNYGARLIYLDACSSHVVVENNVCYNSSQEALLHQSGRENIVRNNILMFGKSHGQIGCFYRENNPDDTAFTFLRNIVVTDGLAVFHHYVKGENPLCRIHSDANLFWDVSGTPDVEVSDDGDMMPFDTWRRDYGCDLHSVVADPRFLDTASRDYRLKPDSPALALGFRPIDTSDVGPRQGLP